MRRIYDDPDAKVGADAAHLESCAECQARFEAVSNDARSIATLLAVSEARVDVGRAFERVMQAPQSQPKLVRFPVMGPTAHPVRLAFIAAVAAAATVIVAFAASGLFFQPTQVKAVPVTLADVEALSQLADYGTLTWTKEPQLQVTTSAADAAALAGGLQPPVVSNLPAGVSTTVTYGGMSEAIATFKFSAEKAAASAARTGKTLPTMPANMDGATLTITLGPAVGEIFGEFNQPATGAGEINLPQLLVAKSVSPKVTSTQVSVKDLEDYVLAQPGISAELKKTITAFGDPSTTLFIPVPIEYAKSTSVKVQGVDGVAVGDETGVGSGVVWVKDGHVYAVAGSIKQSDAVNIANNLK